VIGAQASQSNLLTQHTIIEASIRELPTPIKSTHKKGEQNE
jgi:hypothetical protein